MITADKTTSIELTENEIMHIRLSLVAFKRVLNTAPRANKDRVAVNEKLLNRLYEIIDSQEKGSN